MNLEDLDDVIITDPQAGHTLKKVAEGWINQPACAKDEEQSVPDVPDDGNAYLRKYDEWILHVDDNNELCGFPEAPDTGLLYARNGLSKSWEQLPDIEDIDLSLYTKRTTQENISRGWEFHLPKNEDLRVSKFGDDKDNSFAALGRSGKLTLHGGAQGSIQDASIIFESDMTERQPWPFETKIQLTRVPVVKSDDYDDIIGLACIGGGITFMENDQDENNKLGLINITPRGLDIKRVIGSRQRVGAIDWKITDNLSTADPTFDVRMRMTDINIGGEVDNVDNEPGLAVMGNGMVIVPTEDDADDKQGHVYITPKFIDLTRADGKPRIRFSSRQNGASYESDPAFAEIKGMGDDKLQISATGGVIYKDSIGSFNLRDTHTLVTTLLARLTAAEAKIAALEGNQGGY